jgi:hypothetical protein
MKGAKLTRALVAPHVLGLTPLGANISEFNDVVFSVVGYISVDNEAPTVTSLISRICQSNL